MNRKKTAREESYILHVFASVIFPALLLSTFSSCNFSIANNEEYHKMPYMQEC